MKKEIIYKKTLDFINQIRKSHFQKPLKKIRNGFSQDSFRCPISNSLKECVPPGFIFVQRYEIRVNQVKYIPPLAVQHFLTLINKQPLNKSLNLKEIFGEIK